jgi:hypothetical protein
LHISKYNHNNNNVQFGKHIPTAEKRRLLSTTPDYRLKMARNKDLSSETHQSILVLRSEGYSMRGIANSPHSIQMCTTATFKRGYKGN